MKIAKIYNILASEFEKHPKPVVDIIESEKERPFFILVTTILSARTKDVTTYKVAKKLFSKIDSYKDLKKISSTDLKRILYPIGFYKNKAKYLKKLPEVLENKFDGKVPDDIESLLQLPGVGRKTANLVRTIAFKKPAMCVDTHVHRICNRLGYVKTNTPYGTEMALRKKLPKKYWINFNSYLVSFGQNHCLPRNPKCSTCKIFKYCSRVNVKSKFLPTK